MTECLLPANRTLFEMAADLTGGKRIDDCDPDIIKTIIDPWRIPYPLLPWLAWGLRVNIWSEAWPEMFKRWVVASEVERHRIKGSLAGIKAYLKLVDAAVVQAITPPATTFLADNYSEEDRRAYLAMLPQVRIYPYFPRAQGINEFFLGQNNPAAPLSEFLTSDSEELSSDSTAVSSDRTLLITGAVVGADGADFLGAGPDDDHVVDTFFLMPNMARDPYEAHVTYWDRDVETSMVAKHLPSNSPDNHLSLDYYELVQQPIAGAELFLSDDKNFLDDGAWLGADLSVNFIFRLAGDVVQNPGVQPGSVSTINPDLSVASVHPTPVFENGSVIWGAVHLGDEVIFSDSAPPPLPSPLVHGVLDFSDGYDSGNLSIIGAIQ